MTIDNKLVIVISGEPKQGKSFGSRYLVNNYSNCSLIATDDVFIEYLNNNINSEVDYIVDYINVIKLKYPINEWELHIRDLFLLMSDSVITDFGKHLKRIIDEYYSKNSNVIVIEGWSLKYYMNIINNLADYSTLIKIKANNRRYTIDTIDGDWELEELPNKIKDLIISNHINFNYQTFLDREGDSNSEDKYNKLNLPDTKDKLILDVGCNTGYFCFKIEDAKFTTGLDININFLKTASIIKNSIYQRNNIEFLNTDIFNFNTLLSYDIILCLSVFHYFREHQQHFIDKCYDMLNKGGVLILECGVSENNKDEIYTEKYCRNSETTPCYYPNEKTLIEMASRFTLAYKGLSVLQRGDKIQRYVYHFVK